jgi:hypothetical protein
VTGHFVFSCRPLALLGAELREFTIVLGYVEIGRAEQIVFGAGRERLQGDSEPIRREGLCSSNGVFAGWFQAKDCHTRQQNRSGSTKTSVTALRSAAKRIDQ